MNNNKKKLSNLQTGIELGLSKKEFEKIIKILDRQPNFTELCIFSAMWSEHCSYKSSKKWLKTLKTDAPWVICGPGENAGVIDIGDGLAAVFKMESHNHPSFIDPYQGAATGVGGIMRDIFTMGARPIANMNCLHFGDPENFKTKYLISGVVSGIGGYGNCVGIPTVGGQTDFNKSYNGNNIVNAMTLGIAPSNKIFYSTAAGIGNPLIYVGSKTGKDGIHGATMASTSFEETTENKRPTVQVGDPFTEKLLLEACLELMEKDVIISIQDMGAAGLTSSAFEMASKGGVGIELQLEKVPQREKNMQPFELMLSESQERMLLVIKAGKEIEAKRVFSKWDLPFSIIGNLTDTGRMILKYNNFVEADLPIEPLVSEAPEYDRPWKKTKIKNKTNLQMPPKNEIEKILFKLIQSPNLCSKKWIWEQYDSMVLSDTISGPGGDAAIVRIHNSNKGLAITTDCTPRYVAAHPETGAKQAVAEAWRNLISVGAKPLAITNCLNYGNPEKPEIMGQLVESIFGINEACEALNFPVVSGNVSLYNETNSNSINPTPNIGGVGIIEDLNHIANTCWLDGENIIVIGKTYGHLHTSLFAEYILNNIDGPPPKVDLDVEVKNGKFIKKLINKNYIKTCHDISDGGLLVAIAEMAVSSGLGAYIKTQDSNFYNWWFGEDQGRYIITCNNLNLDKIVRLSKLEHIELNCIGKVGGDLLNIDQKNTICISELRKQHEAWLPQYMINKS
ncbi:phosphoribosylformylglycinamidine synthase subunit PurL [Alphaproteobacteria bacterium]|nr:phosphoribosylformylglycinamidine synthase subunit PurL [Alphaproteobacteria bacterium]